MWIAAHLNPWGLYFSYIYHKNRYLPHSPSRSIILSQFRSMERRLPKSLTNLQSTLSISTCMKYIQLLLYHRFKLIELLHSSHRPDEQCQEHPCNHILNNEISRKVYWIYVRKGVRIRPAPINEPLATISFPWVLKVTPRLTSVPLRTVYIVAICNTVAFRAALSDWKYLARN